ncbi:MAG: hypothetical protein V4717_03760 [Bacteroidota bacterium]
MNDNLQHIISKLQTKWTIHQVLILLIGSLAFTLIFLAVVSRLLVVSWWMMPVVLTAGILLLYYFWFKPIKPADITRYLNKTHPGMEESADLVLEPYDTLNLLQQLQYQKIVQSLTLPVAIPKTIVKQQRISILILLVAAMCSAFIFFYPANHQDKNLVENSGKPVVFKPEIILPQVKQVTIIVASPMYTGINKKEQNNFNITAAENSVITWKITTTVPVKKAGLLFNDKSVLLLKAQGKDNMSFTSSKQVSKAGFYQLQLDTSQSELYKIEILNDQPPSITVQSPKPNTLIEAGRPQVTNIQVSVTDDYGVKKAFIAGTIASGNGEAVKFSEQQLSFNNFTPGKRQYQLQKQINLSSLGMVPGDELYFYISSTDNNNQEKRSGIYIVRLEDISPLMSMDGLANGLDIKPEFFRSQRQIIIETEQLLKDRDTLSVQDFNKKSNDLGIDQKLLRLRYGKFLGEETDAEIGADHDHDEPGHEDETTVFSSAEKIMEQYAHMHDRAEDATFFDAQTKKQLKATLAEMWKAELQLRTLSPKNALPFEYKALKLLKELQQQTRVYVAKTGIKTPALKPEKRLTGELTDILQPVSRQDYKVPENNLELLRKALAVLALLEVNTKPGAVEWQILQEANLQLATKAASDPSGYLPALQALQNILRQKGSGSDVQAAGKGLHKMVASVPKQPQQTDSKPGMPLSERYFYHLKKRQ